MKSSLSVIIVTYNGFKYVTACVKSILKLNNPRIEIIIVDNGSIDDTVGKLKNLYRNRIKVISLKHNYGPAYARNVGAKAARGEILGFLDNDTKVHPNWAKTAIQYFRNNSQVGIIQSKLLLASNHKQLDYVGEYLGQNGFLVQPIRAGEIDEGQFDHVMPTLAAKSAGMFIRKSVFSKIGGFDPDYFIYVEETDLGWRSWLIGFQAVYLPDSIVYHEFGTSSVILSPKQTTFNAKFHGCKNYILTHLKNLEAISLLKIMPLHLFLWLGLAWYSLFKFNFSVFWYIHRAILWNLVKLPTTLKKRSKIQKNRKISDPQLFAIVMNRQPFNYFLNKVISKHRIGNAQSF